MTMKGVPGDRHPFSFIRYEDTARLQIMRTDLSIEDLGGFLDEPFVAVLATLRRDGSVLLAPVWHEWRDGGFNVWISEGDVKGRNLRRDPRASIVVAESEPPLRAVEVRGEAVFVNDAVRETAVRIASRYIGDRGAEYVDAAPGHAVIHLAPGALRVWDFVDEYPSG
jgi:PPOX class probable F420-dependent enzyme